MKSSGQPRFAGYILFFAALFVFFFAFLWLKAQIRQAYFPPRLHINTLPEIALSCAVGAAVGVLAVALRNR